MAVRRSSSVAAEARAVARERRTNVLAARRERERRIAELADEHAVAVAMAAEIRARAEREVAAQMAKADKAIAYLLDLGERADSVAELLDLKVPEVRAARRRTRSAEADGDAATDGTDASSAEPARVGAEPGEQVAA